MKQANYVEFKVRAEFESAGGWPLVNVVITGNHQGIFIDYLPISKVVFDNIKLRFYFFQEIEIIEGVRCNSCDVCDCSSNSEIKIKEIYQSILQFYNPQQILGNNLSEVIAFLPKMPLISLEQANLLRANIEKEYGGSTEDKEIIFRKISSQNNVIEVWGWSLGDVLSDEFLQINLGDANFLALQNILKEKFGADYLKLFKGLHYHFAQIFNLHCDKILELKNSAEYQAILPFIRNSDKISIRDLYLGLCGRVHYSFFMTKFSLELYEPIMKAEGKLIEVLAKTLID